MKRFIAPVILALALILASGCTLQSASTSPVVQSSTEQVGRVEIRVTDAPREDNVTEIWVGVSSVEIHKAGPDQESDGDGEWISANITGPNPFELLALKDGGIQEILGEVNLTSGNYTQIRLNVDNVTVVIDGVLKPAEVPSGKIKFVHPFEVVDGKTTVLLFDFDAAKSVKVAGNSGKILVKPVIKLTSEKPAQTNIPLKIMTKRLPDGAVGVSYNVTLEAQGGLTPYKWALSGTYPSGLSLGAGNGILSGIPAMSENYTFTVQVTDNATEPKTASREYTIEITP